VLTLEVNPDGKKVQNRTHAASKVKKRSPVAIGISPYTLSSRVKKSEFPRLGAGLRILNSAVVG